MGAQAAQAAGGRGAFLLVGGGHRPNGGGVPPGAADPQAGAALRRHGHRHHFHGPGDCRLLQCSQGRFPARPARGQGAHRAFRRGVPPGAPPQGADGLLVGDRPARFRRHLLQERVHGQRFP